MFSLSWNFSKTTCMRKLIFVCKCPHQKFCFVLFCMNSYKTFEIVRKIFLFHLNPVSLPSSPSRLAARFFRHMLKSINYTSISSFTWLALGSRYSRPIVPLAPGSGGREKEALVAQNFFISS